MEESTIHNLSIVVEMHNKWRGVADLLCRSTIRSSNLVCQSLQICEQLLFQ